jgi:hypothetical protein
LTGVRALGFAVLVFAVALGGTSALGARRAPSAASFVSTCPFAHRAADDPIVYPREPGYSHDHTFVGNVSTNAFSTLRSLSGAKSTCYRYGDTAAYWAPTLYIDGSPVPPRTARLYYRRLTSAPVRAFPPGLRMVAGNSHAWRPQTPAVTHWDCSVLKENFYGTRSTQSALRVAASSVIPHCSKYSELQLIVNFPDCWNGTSIDSANHKSHMAYSVAGTCPASHPVAVPGLSLVYNYPPRVGGVVVLSSGTQYSGHADFINSWNEPALTKLVDDCLNHGRGCTGD